MYKHRGEFLGHVAETVTGNLEQEAEGQEESNN